MTSHWLKTLKMLRNKLTLLLTFSVTTINFLQVRLVSSIFLSVKMTEIHSTTDTYEYELVSLIESLNLTDKQKEYLSLIVSYPSLKSVDIAKILGVGRSAIAMYNKRIREKMVSFGLAI